MSNLLKPGDVLDDSYEIVEFISKGGFGAVYRARQLSMDRDVALKLLIPGAQPDYEGLVKRFRNEVKAVRNLRHPNTVQIYDFHEARDGQLYFTMEYLEGRSLRDLLKSGEALSPKRTANILTQSLKSLAEAHSTGIIHRDIKPANIMLVDMYGEDDFVKVLDFGIAKAAEDQGQSGGDEPLTRTGYLVGTVRYMAPERIAGDPAGSYSDIYSLGLVGASLLIGRPLLGNSSRLEAMQLQMSAKPLPIPQAILDSGLGPVLRRALAKNPKHRYQAAEDMLDDLMAVPDADLEDDLLHFTGELPMSDALGGATSSGIEPTTVDSEIQSGSMPTSASQPEPTEVTPSFQQRAPTGWGEQEAVRAPNEGTADSAASGGPPPMPRGEETSAPNKSTVVFESSSVQRPPTSELARDESDSDAASARSAGSRDSLETASKRFESDSSASSILQSKVALIAIATVVLVALGAALTWALLPDEKTGGEPAEDSTSAASAAPPQQTLVELQSSPSGANVLENGELLGVTPIQLEPEEGRRLMVSLEGYQRRSIELGPDVPSAYSVELTELSEQDNSLVESDEAAQQTDGDDTSEDEALDTDETVGSNTDDQPEQQPEEQAESSANTQTDDRERTPRRTPPSRTPDPEPQEESDDSDEVIPVFGAGDESEPESTPESDDTEKQDSDEDIPVF